MTAILAADKTLVRVGQPVQFTGHGYAGNTGVTLSVDNLESWTAEIVTDVDGYWGTTDIADHASGTLTLTGLPLANETVVIGSTTYTWKASVTTTANQVKIGADAATSIQNLVAAINAGAGSGTVYGSATVANTQVTAYASDATTLSVAALTGGTGGNAIATTETLTNGSWGAVTLTGGSASTGNKNVVWTPVRAGTYNVTANDGTNTKTTQVRVWS